MDGQALFRDGKEGAVFLFDVDESDFGHLLVPCVLLDRAGSHAAREVFLDKERHDEDRHRDHDACRAHQFPQVAAFGAEADEADRQRHRVPARQDQREQEFVPRQDEAEDRRGQDTGCRHRQHDVLDHPKAGRTVDHGRLFAVDRNGVDEALDHLDDEGSDDRQVDHDQRDPRVQQPEAAEHQEERQHDHDGRNELSRQDQKEQELAPPDPKPRKGVGRQRRAGHRDQRP